MKIQDLVLKEDGLLILEKMDAVGIQGVWLDFPGSVAVTGKLKRAAQLYYQLYQQEVEKRKRKKEPPDQQAKRLMRKVEKRLQEEDAEDLLTILSM